MFVLKVMGTLALRSSDGPAPAEASQRKRLALLALLAIAGDRGLSRDRIQAFLWPESDSGRSRHALDQLVYAIRRALGADPFLSAGHDLRLNPAVLDSDLRRFREAVKRGELELATECYDGVLLDGFPAWESRELEGWVDGERAKAVTEYQAALETLAKRATSRGDIGAAISWRRKLTQSDPLSARFAADMIRALTAGGDRSAALQYAAGYARLVREELGVAPDPAIAELIDGLTSPAPVSEATVRQPARPADKTVRTIAPDFAVQTAEPAAARSRPSWRRAFPAVVAAVAVVALGGLTKLYGTARGDMRVELEAMGREHGRATRPEASRYYHAGVTLWNDRSKEGLDSSVVLFRRAVEVDPIYSEAYSGLANAYVMLGYSGYRPAQAMFAKAKAAALRSIRLDSTLAPPYAALGMALTGEREFAAAEAAFRKGLSLDSRYATGHQWFGILLMILGREDESVAELARAAELDPLSLQIQNNYATFLSAAGDPAASLRHYEKMVHEEPDTAWVRRNPWLLTNMAAASAAAGRYDMAQLAARRAVEILPDHPRALSALANVHLGMGQPRRARAVYARADTSNEHYASYDALLYLREGNPDSAFVVFDRVREWGIPIMISLAILSPEVKKDPRYGRLLKRIGMPARAPK